MQDISSIKPSAMFRILAVLDIQVKSIPTTRSSELSTNALPKLQVLKSPEAPETHSVFTKNVDANSRCGGLDNSGSHL